MAYISFENVCKYYKMGQNVIAAADGLSFSVEKGEFCVVVGPSGAGKTTLLNILGGMDVCDSGKIMLDGTEISALGKKQLTDYRRYDVGFVFQFYNLVPTLTVYVLWSSIDSLLALAGTKGKFICAQNGVTEEDFLDYGFRQVVNSILEARI